MDHKVTGAWPASMYSGGRRRCTVRAWHRGKGGGRRGPQARQAHQEHTGVDSGAGGGRTATGWCSNGGGRRGRRPGRRRRLRAPQPDSLRGEGEGDGAELVAVFAVDGEVSNGGDSTATASAPRRTGSWLGLGFVGRELGEREEKHGARRASCRCRERGPAAREGGTATVAWRQCGRPARSLQGEEEGEEREADRRGPHVRLSELSVVPSASRPLAL